MKTKKTIKKPIRKIVKPKKKVPKFIHFVMTPFTGLGLENGFRGNDWLAKRIKIFKDHTLKSLLNQKNKNFVHWICWRREEIDNPLVQDLMRYLYSLKSYKFVFTFGGIPLWDDKYENDGLAERLKVMLPQLTRIVGDAEYVIRTSIDSDDMFAKDAIDIIQKEFAKTRLICFFKNGYLYDVEKGKLAEWKPMTIPPFYTLVYPKEDFLNHLIHFDFIKTIKSHEFVESFPCKKLLDGKYCVSVHGSNISTLWNHPFKGKELKGEAKKKVLKSFGLTK